MKSRFILLLIIISFLIFPVSTSAQDETITTEEWRADIEYFAEQFPRRHPNAFYRVSEEVFNAEVENLLTDLPELTDAQIIVRIRRLVSMIEDGHTSMLPNYDAFYPLSHYPLDFYAFEDGVYVVNATAPYEEFIGAKLVHVGTMDVESAYALLEKTAVYENEWTQRLTTANQFYEGVMLLGAGIIEDIAAPNFVFEMINGETVTLNPEPLAFGTFLNFIGNEFNLPVREDVLYLSNRDTFWWMHLTEENVVYLQYNMVGRTNSEGVTLASVANDIEDLVDSGDIERVVIDLRHNPGGNVAMYVSLRTFLMDHEFFQQPDHLIILIGRQTFSAAVVLSLQLEDLIGPVFMGEPTGGMPNMFENAGALRLPNSGLTINVATRSRQDGGEDDLRPAVEPSIHIPLTSVDYFAGNDPVLEAALNYQP